MNIVKAWIAYKIGHLGVRLIMAHAKMMERLIPGGLPRGEMDAVAHLMTNTLGLDGLAMVMVNDADWCKCGKGAPHRQTHIRLSSWGLRDDQLVSHMQHLAAGLEGNLRVARHEQHGTPLYDA
jgi:hypothetical protein